MTGDRREHTIPVFKSGPRRGQPKHPWALCAYDLSDATYAEVENTPEIEVVAALDELDRPLHSIQKAKRDRMQGLGDRHGLGNVETPRQIVDALGLLLDRNFDARKHLGQSAAPPTGSFAADTYAGTAGTEIQTRAGETAGWTADTTPKVKLSGNGSARTGTANQSTRAKSTGVPATADYDVRDVFKRITGTAGNLYVIGRLVAGTTFYELGYESDGTWRIYLLFEGSPTELGSYSGDTFASDGVERVALFSMRGTALKGYVDDVERISVTDSTLTAKGVPGIAVYDNVAQDAGGYHFTVFTATDAGGATVTGAASVSGAGTVAASGTRIRLGVASVSGSGTVAASGVRSANGQAAVAGAGTVAATGIRTALGTASVVGGGAISAGGLHSVFGAASVSGTGTLAAAGRLTLSGTAAVSGAGSLTAAGTRSTSSTGSVSGSGSVAATAYVVVLGSASVNGAGIVAAVGVLSTTGTASVVGAGTVSATGARFVTGQTAVAGSGAIQATGSRTVPGVVALIGQGSVSASGLRTALASASVVGAGVVLVSGYAIHPGAAAVAGTGVISATGTTSLGRLAPWFSPPLEMNSAIDMESEICLSPPPMT